MIKMILKQRFITLLSLAAAASIVISSHSCSDAMPTLAQIEQFIAQHQSGSAARN